MRRMATLRWSDFAGEGNVKFSNEFETADRITKLDALVDWIAALKEEYERMISEGGVFDLSKDKP